MGFIGKAILSGVRLGRQQIRILGYHQLESGMSREELRGKDVDVGLRNVKVYLGTSLDQLHSNGGVSGVFGGAIPTGSESSFWVMLDGTL